MRVTNAMVHSIDDIGEVEVLEWNSDNDITVRTKQGVVCKAIFNPFVGRIYADDLYAVLDNYKESYREGCNTFNRKKKKLGESNPAKNEFDFTRLNKIATDLYNSHDDEGFLDFSNNELAVLWAYCGISAENPYGQPYDDEVYEAIREKEDRGEAEKDEIFIKADKIWDDLFTPLTFKSKEGTNDWEKETDEWADGLKNSMGLSDYKGYYGKRESFNRKRLKEGYHNNSEEYKKYFDEDKFILVDNQTPNRYIQTTDIYSKDDNGRTFTAKIEKHPAQMDAPKEDYYVGGYKKGKGVYGEWETKTFNTLEDTVKWLKSFLEETKDGLSEGTKKTKSGKWINKGKSGKDHGKFSTKKKADEQRKAMFARGWKPKGVKEGLTEDIDFTSFKKELKKTIPADDIDGYQSDLYLRVTPETTALIKKYGIDKSTMLSKFRDNIEHDMWYELPFVNMDEYIASEKRELGESKIPYKKNRLKERNLTRAERHNRDADRIFGHKRGLDQYAKKFLGDKGYSAEDVKKFYDNDDLGGEITRKFGKDVWSEVVDNFSKDYQRNESVSRKRKLKENRDYAKKDANKEKIMDWLLDNDKVQKMWDWFYAAEDGNDEDEILSTLADEYIEANGGYDPKEKSYKSFEGSRKFGLRNKETNDLLYSSEDSRDAWEDEPTRMGEQNREYIKDLLKKVINLYAFYNFNREDLGESKLPTRGKKKLKERWEYTLNSGRSLQQAINSGDPQEVLRKLKKAYDELERKDLISQSDLLDAMEEITDAEEEPSRERVDELLDELYDFCDLNRIWVGM